MHDHLKLPVGPLGFALAAASAALTFDFRPRSDCGPVGYRGRKTKKPNPNAKKQAAAKRARKITAKSCQRASKERTDV